MYMLIADLEVLFGLLTKLLLSLAAIFYCCSFMFVLSNDECVSVLFSLFQ